MKNLKKWELIVLILLGLTPLLWFLGKNSNVIINGIDTNFPLDPLVWFKRRFFVWDSVINLGRDFSSSTSGFFFHLLQVIPFVLGFSLQVTQILNLVFWFSLLIFSAYIFARVFISKSFLPQIVFVILYSFNIYLFNTWENVKVANLALVISIPLFLSILKLFKSGKIKTGKLVLYSVISSIVSLGAGINPAYFAVLVISMLTYSLITSLTERKSLKKIWRGTLTSMTVLVALNLFWILPLVSFLFISNKPGSVEDLGFASWIHSLSTDTSIANVFRLRGAWDWYVWNEAGFPLYIPYALNYFNRASFILFSFVTPALAVLSLIFQNKKEKSVYLFFAVIMMLGVFLGAGSHAPTGSLFLFLYERVPFLNFFRSPWYIFTPLLILSLAALSALFVRWVENALTNKVFYSKVKWGHFVKLFVLIFLVGHLLYSYPLVTGKIFRPGRSDSFFVEFPDYIWDAKEWLDDRSVTDSRIITYPDDDIENFGWGYRGTESILGLYSDREYVSPSFNIENKSYKALLSRLYTYFKSGRYESAVSLFKHFGADTLFVKEDAQTHSSELDYTRFGDNYDLTRMGEWVFLEFRDETGKKIFSPTNAYMDETSEAPDAFSLFADVLMKNSIVIDHRDSEVKNLPEFRERTLRVFELENISLNSNPTSRMQEYEFDVVKKGKYNLVIEKKGLNISDILIDSETITLSNSKAEETDDKAIFKLTDVKKGRHKLTITYPETEDLVQIDDYSSLYDVPDMREEELNVDKKKTFIMKAGDEGMRVHIPTNGFDPFVNYRLLYDHKYFYGHSLIIDAIQYNPSTLLRVHATNTGASFDWEHKYFDIFPAEIVSDLEIVVRIPIVNKRDKSRSFIENIRMFRMYDNRVFFVEEKKGMMFPEPPNIAFKKISPVEYEVKATNVSSDYLLTFLENYNEGWVLSSKDILGDPIHFSANGYANTWYVSASLSSQNMKLYYKPQRMYLGGLAVSLSVFVFSIILSTKQGKRIKLKLRRKKKKK